MYLQSWDYEAASPDATKLVGVGKTLSQTQIKAFMFGKPFNQITSYHGNVIMVVKRFP